MSDERTVRDRLQSQRKKMDYYARNRSELIQSFMSNFQNPKEPVVAGTVVVFPLVVVGLVVIWLFEKLNQVPGNQFFNITEFFYVNQLLKLSFLLVAGAVIVTGIGRFVNTRTGFEFERLLDIFMDSIPFLGSVYNISKVTIDTLLTGPEGFREPVKLDFHGARLTGFRTGNMTDDGRDVIFMPTSPNITTGFVLELEQEDLIETDETTEEALTRVLSAGFGASNKREGLNKDIEDED